MQSESYFARRMKARAHRRGKAQTSLAISAHTFRAALQAEISEIRSGRRTKLRPLIIVCKDDVLRGCNPGSTYDVGAEKWFTRLNSTTGNEWLAFDDDKRAGWPVLGPWVSVPRVLWAPFGDLWFVRQTASSSRGRINSLCGACFKGRWPCTGRSDDMLRSRRSKTAKCWMEIASELSSRKDAISKQRPSRKGAGSDVAGDFSERGCFIVCTWRGEMQNSAIVDACAAERRVEYTRHRLRYGVQSPCHKRNADAN
eukprot:1146529-Pleurochrysis_carterae.AAC.2